MDNYLAQHPEIFMAPQKEVHFFGRDLKFGYNRPGPDNYISIFDKATTEKCIGESSVWYLYSKTAAKEIRLFAASAKIIIMLRNPVEMIYSQHSQFLYNGNEDIDDFDQALKAMRDRKDGRRIPAAAMFPDGLLYTDIAKYSGQVGRYLDVFGRENVHTIIFDDFKKDAGEVYQKTLGFLNVDASYAADFKCINPNKRVRSKLLRGLIFSPPKLLRDIARPLVPNILKGPVIKALVRSNTKYPRRPPMNEGTRKRLQAEFRPEIERLSALLNRDLTGWCD